LFPKENKNQKGQLLIASRSPYKDDSLEQQREIVHKGGRGSHALPKLGRKALQSLTLKIGEHSPTMEHYRREPKTWGAAMPLKSYSPGRLLRPVFVCIIELFSARHRAISILTS
jgi:hypothetical protein